MTDDRVPDDSGAAQPSTPEAGGSANPDPASPWPGVAAPPPPRAGADGDADPALPPWADAARPRGLDAYFAPGGEDDAPPARVADERRMLRLLILMVALLVGIPTLLTLIAVAAQLVAVRSGG